MFFCLLTLESPQAPQFPSVVSLLSPPFFFHTVPVSHLVLPPSRLCIPLSIHPSLSVGAPSLPPLVWYPSQPSTSVFSHLVAGYREGVNCVALNTRVFLWLTALVGDEEVGCEERIKGAGVELGVCKGWRGCSFLFLQLECLARLNHLNCNWTSFHSFNSCCLGSSNNQNSCIYIQGSPGSDSRGEQLF